MDFEKLSAERYSLRKFDTRPVEQEYTVDPAGFRALCTRKPGAFLETGSLFPPLTAHRPFPPLGFPAHTLHPQGVCSIRSAAEPLAAALPFRRGEFTTLSTVFNCITVLFSPQSPSVNFYPRFQRPFCFSIASHCSRRRVS